MKLPVRIEFDKFAKYLYNLRIQAQRNSYSGVRLSIQIMLSGAKTEALTHNLDAGNVNI